MEDVLLKSFVPHVMVVASPECTAIFDHPLLKSNEIVTTSAGMSVRLYTLPQMQASTHISSFTDQPDATRIIRDARSGQHPDLFHAVTQRIVSSTLEPQYAQPFETFGHPLACICVVSSANPSPISALTQLYQRSYSECPPGMSADFLRCFWYINENGESDEGENGSAKVGEDFDTVASQFGPHCFEVANSDDAIAGAIDIVTTHSIYPYLHRLIKEWQVTSSGRNAQGGFALGGFLKKLVKSGPPRPENNLFKDVCREMQPHVASIPARRKDGRITSSTLDVDMQLRRLADVAFILRDYSLAYSAYDSLRKRFNSEQRWGELGACREMLAVTGTLCKMGDVRGSVDGALYAFNSQLSLPVHALRCVLVVCGCLVEFGDQLLAAGLLSTTLLDIDPKLGSGDEAEKTAMLMEKISLAFEKRGWHRKSKLWSMLAMREWDRADQLNVASS